MGVYDHKPGQEYPVGCLFLYWGLAS
jgi:hypothetical protein